MHIRALAFVFLLTSYAEQTLSHSTFPLTSILYAIQVVHVGITSVLTEKFYQGLKAAHKPLILLSHNSKHVCFFLGGGGGGVDVATLQTKNIHPHWTWLGPFKTLLNNLSPCHIEVVVAILVKETNFHPNTKEICSTLSK